jgi:hypothetical protein
MKVYVVRHMYVEDNGLYSDPVTHEPFYLSEDAAIQEYLALEQRLLKNGTYMPAVWVDEVRVI